MTRADTAREHGARAADALPDTVSSLPASPVLSSRSWVFGALRQLWALGLLEEAFDAGTPALTCQEAARLFGVAMQSARERRPGALPVAEAYAAALRRESERCPFAGRRWGVGLQVGYHRFRGGVRAGIGYALDDWTGNRPLSDTSTAVLRAPVTALLTRNLSLVAVPELRTGGVRLSEGQVTLAAGPIAAWAGRRAFRFGPAVAGGIVLTDAVTFDGGGAYLSRPIRFPWLFRAMGPIRMESFLSRVRGGDRIRDPYFAAFRGTMAPHPRVIVGLSRAAMFGGDGNDPITLRNMAFIFFGGTQSGSAGHFANDMLSVDVQYRPRFGSLPLTTFLEWGMDDAAGAWHHEPGYTAGLSLGSLPGAPWASFGAEWTSFARHYSQNTIWYRNFSLRNGWTDDGLIVGSPLGGNGKQLLGYLDAIASGGVLALRTGAFYRDRGPENLLAPERTGISRGGYLRLRLRGQAPVSGFADVEVERGRGWTFSHLVTGMDVRFPSTPPPASSPSPLQSSNYR